MATPSTSFALSPELDEAIATAAEAIATADCVVALTGAGLSVESGIPPFRGPGGLWTRYGEPPLDGYQRFLADPERAWRERLNPSEPWARALRETLDAAKPNPGHLALAELERRGRLHALITQNIDGLHTDAGSQAVLEIHGNAHQLRCIACVTRFDPAEFAVDETQLPPHCPECGGLVKGDTVQFGEPIPPDVLEACTQAVARADCMLVAGTSATVFPAAEFPLTVRRHGGRVVEVNPDETELSGLATDSLRGPGGVVLERLLFHVGRTGGAP
ncbi:MAG: Sir2 family NAD-dependent protein deacetylase [Proteobacteria bacterium]|nr:Sir2 family NAD-dependent protein deacetylase [Pseudomonadota bacterium]